jgi:predicted MFS family arabinose efflux permease
VTGAKQGDTCPAIWPALVAVLTGAAVFNLAPLYLEASARRYALDQQQIGWLMSAEIAGIALASFLVLLLQNQLAVRRLTLVGTLIIIGGNLLSASIAQFEVFLVSRFFIGLLGEGLVYVTAIITLGRHSNPVWSFALLSFSNMCFSALMLLGVPRLVGTADIVGLLLLFSTLGIVLLIAWHWYPGDSRDGKTAVFASRLSRVGWSGLLGLTLFGANLGAVWSYAERLGASIGMETATSAQLLSVAIGFQALGSLLAMWLSHRLRAEYSLVGVALGQCIAMLLLALADSPWAYLAGVALWGASWNLGAANLLGLLSHLPDRRNVLALAPGFEATGVTLGPLGVAAMIGPGLQLIMPLVGFTTALLGLLLFVAVIRHMNTAGSEGQRATIKSR